MSRQPQPEPRAEAEGRREKRCPVCGRPRVHCYRPFCSPGCRDRDLLAWLAGRYALPAVEASEEAAGPADGD